MDLRAAEVTDDASPDIITLNGGTKGMLMYESCVCCLFFLCVFAYLAERGNIERLPIH